MGVIQIGFIGKGRRMDDGTSASVQHTGYTRTTYAFQAEDDSPAAEGTRVPPGKAGRARSARRGSCSSARASRRACSCQWTRSSSNEMPCLSAKSSHATIGFHTQFGYNARNVAICRVIRASRCAANADTPLACRRARNPPASRCAICVP